MNFLENKYTKWYYAIIEGARLNQSLLGEMHHILPKSLGGGNERNNLVRLSFRQHFICHHLLSKMTIGDAKAKMMFAFYMLRLKSKQHTRPINSRQYELLKRIRRQINISDVTRQQMSQSMIGKNVGKTASPETRTKMSIAARSRNEVSSITRKKISMRLKQEWADGTRKVPEKFKQTGKSMLGKNHSEETKLKQSIAAKNDPRRKLPRQPLSEETKKKIAEKARDRYEKKREIQ